MGNFTPGFYGYSVLLQSPHTALCVLAQTVQTPHATSVVFPALWRSIKPALNTMRSNHRAGHDLDLGISAQEKPCSQPPRAALHPLHSLVLPPSCSTFPLHSSLHS